MKKIVFSAAAVLSLASVSSVVSADEGFSVFSNTKFSGEIRPRYEYVDVDPSTKLQANAYTVRAALGMQSTLFGIDGLSMKVEGMTVQTLGSEDYNDLSADKRADYEVVADPEQTRFTQAYLQYKYGATVLSAGRQLINLDNQRFIGSVDWRQMPQSLDAVTLTNTSVPGLNLMGAYVYSYETVFDEKTWDSKSVILHGSYKVSDMLKITAYDYMISSEKSAYGSDTYGLAINGDVDAGSAKVNYHAEYAKQGDASFKTVGSTKKENDAYYYNLEATASMMGASLGIGQEMLSGTTGTDGKTAFGTPLATLHKFNGTADKFLTTPTGGLVDTYVTLGYKAAGLGNAMATYHSFETDVNMGGKRDLGSEWDIQYTNTIPGVKGLNGLIKAAFYSAGDVAPTTTYADTEKFWLQLDYKF